SAKPMGRFAQGQGAATPLTGPPPLPHSEARAAMIPRLSQNELPPEVAALLRPGVERLGYLGEFFQCAAHQPAALLSFMAFTEDLKHALPDRLTETVALTVSGELENAYERHQHERLCLKLGFGDAWVRAIEERNPSRAKF